jgi:acetyl-CoA hydrolase
VIDLASVIRPGDGIIIGQACAEPQTLVEALAAQREVLSGCGVFLGTNYSGVLKPAHADHLRLSAYCGIGQNRALADAGVLEIVPAPYSQLAGLMRAGQIRADIVFVQVSPPNGKGEYSLGLAADYLVPALAKCRAVVGEVNDQVPWTHSEVVLHRKDFALLVESSRPPASPPVRKPSETDLAIARNAVALIPEGATIEFGIGALPDGVCSLLKNHKSIAVHSGTVGDGIADLPGLKRVDCAMLIGTRKLFDFSNLNPKIQLRSSEYTHNPAVLGKLDRFVAVNSSVEVDLTGQVNGEVAGGSYVGAVGGALDFIRAANQSDGGLSLMLLPSSRIVDRLAGPVSTPRSEAGIIVTEKGIADLRGCSLRERERRLARIR